MQIVYQHWQKRLRYQTFHQGSGFWRWLANPDWPSGNYKQYLHTCLLC